LGTYSAVGDSRQKFLGQLNIGVGAGRLDVVQKDGFAEAWSLSEANVTRNDSLQEKVTEMPLNVLADLLG